MPRRPLYGGQPTRNDPAAAGAGPVLSPPPAAAGAGPATEEPEYSEEEIFQEYDDTFRKVSTVIGILGDKVEGAVLPGRKDLLLPVEMRTSYIQYINARAQGKDPEGDIWSGNEGREILAYWNSEEGQKYIKELSTPDVLLSPLTELIKTYSDDSTLDCLKREYGSLRDYFETSTPTTQCGNTVKGVIPGTTICWLCKTPIPDAKMAAKYPSLELSPECEHVFPIAQALCFSGLYESQLFNELAEEAEEAGFDPTKSRAEAYRKGVTLEYQWAHRICNQVKNDTHFITFKDSEFVIDPSMIDQFLDKLQNTPNYGGGKQLIKYITSETNVPNIGVWEQTVGQNIFDISNTLLEYARKSGLTPVQHASVTMMSVRSFIALSDKCGKVVEIIPEVLIQRGLSDLPPTSIDEPLAAAQHGIAIASEHITGYINAILSNLGRNSGITARVRATMLSEIPNIGLVVRDTFTNSVTNRLANDMRLTVFLYLKNQAVSNNTWLNNDRQLWSDFKTWTNQFIIGVIYQQIGVEFIRLLHQRGGEYDILASKMEEIIEFPVSDIGIAPTVAVPEPVLGTVSKSMSLIDSYIYGNVINIILRGGVPYEDIASSIPAVDNHPDKPNPAWFVNNEPGITGGGGERKSKYGTFWALKRFMGGLRTRRSLYSNARKAPLVNVDGTSDDAGLRERVGPSTTRRVRKSSRSTRRRR